MDINQIKQSVETAHNSLQTYGDENISDSLLKHNLNHLLSAASEIASELNIRQVLGNQI